MQYNMLTSQVTISNPVDCGMEREWFDPCHFKCCTNVAALWILDGGNTVDLLYGHWFHNIIQILATHLHDAAYLFLNLR